MRMKKSVMNTEKKKARKRRRQRGAVVSGTKVICGCRPPRCLLLLLKVPKLPLSVGAEEGRKVGEYAIAEQTQKEKRISEEAAATIE